MIYKTEYDRIKRKDKRKKLIIDTISIILVVALMLILAYLKTLAN